MDSEISANIFQGYLKLCEKDFYVIETINESKDVIPTIRRFCPDVVLLEDQLSHVGRIGIDQILPAIKGNFESIRVIIITNRGKDIDPIRRALHWGADDFLDKPIDAVTLRKHVKRAFLNV